MTITEYLRAVALGDDSRIDPVKRIKRSSEPKRLMLYAHVSEDEYQLINDKAKKAKLSTSKYLACAALEKEIVIYEGFKEFAFQLRKVGINLNQLTMLSNQGKITSPDIADVKKMVKEIWQAVTLITVKKSKIKKTD